MTSDDDMNNFWTCYVTKNDESAFRNYISAFVGIWNSNLEMDWNDVGGDLCPPNCGPSLSTLPDELFPAIGKFLYILKDNIDEGSLTKKKIIEAELLVKTLTILSRNSENISSVASPDNVKLITNVLASIISSNLFDSTSNLRDVTSSLCIRCSHFLSHIYDPYFEWKSFQNRRISSQFYSRFLEKPNAIFQAEIVPTLYAYFESKLPKIVPKIGMELLNVYGSIISGSQFNAYHIICPATTNLIFNIICDSQMPSDIRKNAVVCLAISMFLLDQTPLHQRQIEVSFIIELYEKAMLNVVCCDNDENEILRTGREDILFEKVVLKDNNGDIKLKKAYDNDDDDKKKFRGICDDTSDKKMNTCDEEDGKKETCEGTWSDENADDVMLRDTCGDKETLSTDISLEEYNEKASLRDIYDDEINISPILTGISHNKDSEKAPLHDICSDGLHEVPLTIVCDDESKLKCVDENYSVQISLVDALSTVLRMAQNDVIKSHLISRNFVGIILDTADSNWQFGNHLEICIHVLYLLLKGSDLAKKKFKTAAGYARIFRKLKLLDFIRKNILKQLINMIVENDYENSRCHEILNPIPTNHLFGIIYLLSYENQDWLVQILLDLCTHSWKNKWAVMDGKILTPICECLATHTFLSQNCVNLLIKLIYKLSELSLNSAHLKKIINNFQNGNVKLNSFYIKLLRNILKNEKKCSSSDRVTTIFDLQYPVAGLILSDTKKFSPPANGFTFHCWISLYDWYCTKHSRAINLRRRLFLFNCGPDSSLEVFFSAEDIFIICLRVKKEFLMVKIPNLNLENDRWYCLDVCYVPSKRPFGKNQFGVFLDGKRKFQINAKFGPLSENFTSCEIGCVESDEFLIDDNSCKVETSVAKNSENSSHVGILDGFMKRVSDVKLITSGQTDKNDQIIYGCQSPKIIYGHSISLCARLGGCILFQEYLSKELIKLAYDVKLDFNRLLNCEEGNDYEYLNSKIAFCVLPLASYGESFCDLSKFATGVKNDSPIRTLKSTSDVIGGVGGVNSVLYLLELVAGIDVSREEDNPVTAVLLLVHELLRDEMNKMMFLRSYGFPILGYLLTKVPCGFLDVSFLSGVNTLAEYARSSNNSHLLRHVYQYLLFNFSILRNCSNLLTERHLKLISSLIRSDRKCFRKRFGVQFFLDVLRECFDSNCSVVTEEIRNQLVDLLHYYLKRDVNFGEANSIIRFIISTKDELAATAVTDALIDLLENRNCKDQLFLLLYEPRTTELLYGVLAVSQFSMDFKQRLVKLFAVLLRYERVYEKCKQRLRLQDATNCGLYPGLIATMPHSDVISMEVAVMLLDQMFLTDSPVAYAGALSLVRAISLSDLDVKIEIARKILAVVFMKPNAPSMFTKQIGWQDCVVRLIIRQRSDKSKFEKDDQYENKIADDGEVSLSSPSRSLEMDLKGIAGTMTSVVSDNVQYATDNIQYVAGSVTSLAGSVTSMVSDNISYAADNIAGNLNYATGNITNIVSSAYSLIRQKTLEYQSRSLSESPTPAIHPSHIDIDNVATLNERSLSYESLDDLLVSKSSEQEERGGEMVGKDGSSETSSITIADSLSQRGIDEDDEEENIVFDMIERWKNLEMEKIEDKESELCYTVANILFTIMWRGYNNCKDKSYAWKERGNVMTTINLIGLNYHLYCPYTDLKLRLLEMMIQASLSDLVDKSCETARKSESASALLKWIYDMTVIDLHPDDQSTELTSKLLDGVLRILDEMAIFRGDTNKDANHIAKVSFGILLNCTLSRNKDVCSMAAAKLNWLVQTNNLSDLECGYLLYWINAAAQKNMYEECRETYSFLVPLLKVLISKQINLTNAVEMVAIVKNLLSSEDFYEEYKKFDGIPQWMDFIEQRVRPLHDKYNASLIADIIEPMNLFWAECYEDSKMSVAKRNKEVADSKKRFNDVIMSPYQVCVEEEELRYNNMLSQRNGHEILVRQKWNIQKDFYAGPRGLWKCGNYTRFWKLSQRENYHRMRLKLEPNMHFDSHTDASRLRDNTGWVREKSVGDLSQSLNSHWQAALRKRIEESSDDDSLSLDNIDRQEIESDAGFNAQEKEKPLISCECDLVTLMKVVKGNLHVTPSYVQFFDCSEICEYTERYDFKWSLSKLREIYPRRYNLRRTALEFFLIDQMNYFLNFDRQLRKSVFSTIVRLRPANLSHQCYKPPMEHLRSSGLTQKWVNREISNFDYLMQLNTIAGRTYNDLSQYPIFPWILADYTSEQLDLEKPSTFRDLSKPIGVVNPNNVEEVRHRYHTFEDPDGIISKFHYGTHYSNSAGVLHYMVRVEPFTTLHIELQSGRFDVADRLFHSIAQTWNLLMENPIDVKELIPEFFYFPEFLRNYSNYDLGKFQGSNTKLNDVILPNWASSPEDFIFKHREALECEYVSSHLHEWIDLIFGFKQKGQNAVEALNVFYYCSYEGAVDLDAIDDPVAREAIESMINNFGQTPSQLLLEPHPPRLPHKEAIQRMLKCDFKKPDLTLFLNMLETSFIDVGTEKDAIVFVCSPRSSPKGFLQMSTSDTLLTVSSDGFIGQHSWIPHDKYNRKGYYFEVDPYASNTKLKRDSPLSTFHPSVKLHNKLFAVSHDLKYIYSGGHWDYSIKVFSLVKLKYSHSVIKHKGMVTCLSVDSCGWYMISGSQDCTCIIWDISQVNKETPPKLCQSLAGHDQPISAVAINSEMDLAVSGSQDGSVNLYSVHSGQLYRTLAPTDCVLESSVISFVSISPLGHVALAATDQVNHFVHVYSVNGFHCSSKYVLGQVTGMTTLGDYLVVVDDTGELTISHIRSLQSIYTNCLQVPIQTVVATVGNTHLLTPLRDGRLVVLGLPNYK